MFFRKVFRQRMTDISPVKKAASAVKVRTVTAKKKNAAVSMYKYSPEAQKRTIKKEPAPTPMPIDDDAREAALIALQKPRQQLKVKLPTKAKRKAVSTAPGTAKKRATRGQGIKAPKTPKKPDPRTRKILKLTGKDKPTLKRTTRIDKEKRTNLFEANEKLQEMLTQAVRNSEPIFDILPKAGETISLYCKNCKDNCEFSLS